MSMGTEDAHVAANTITIINFFQVELFMSNVLIVYGSTTGKYCRIPRRASAGCEMPSMCGMPTFPDGLCEAGCRAVRVLRVRPMKSSTDGSSRCQAFDRIGVKGVKTACCEEWGQLL